MNNAPEFLGGPRFEVRRRIGAGGFGIVYEVWDHDRAAEVAVKTLARLDPAALYRFKREFRGLADVRHRNLVELYELVSEGKDWLLVMELVRGVDCLQWTGGASFSKEVSTISAPKPDAPPRVQPASPAAAADFPRLRDMLAQLCEGLLALHAAGKLHRDVKPSNVLVEEATGRVVLVDLGILTELEDHAAKNSDQSLIAGTPEYMAPEQGTGDTLTAAADWYSVGVLLFEALTGRLPFVGAPLQILLDKQRKEAPRPSDFVRGLPPDLATLCADLLRPSPESRPSGKEVLRRLGRSDAPRSVSGMRAAVPSTRAERALLVGRDAELARIEDGYEAARRGRPTTVVVSGRSGIGKTALVRSFLDRLDSDAIVLCGRCYERESVPYKALDAVIDELSRALLHLPPREAAAVVPRDAAALVRLFPVLQRVGAIAEAPRRTLVSADPQQLRMRGFGALRELLARLTDRHPLVLFIDDLQWGDADSAALLAELAAPPDPPSFLLIASHRSNEESPPLKLILGTPDRRDLVRIELGPLSREEVRALASTLLGPGAPSALVAGIVDESRGSPLLVREVVDSVQAETGAFSSGFRLADMLRNRLLLLPAPARRLIEVLSVAGRPVRLDHAMRAAELSGDDRRAALDYLRVARLVRATGARGSDTAEPMHDRVREAVLDQLDAETLRVTHGDLARALREAGGADPEALFLHLDAAGNGGLAAHYAEEAAGKAARALAFDRAAHFFRIALDREEDESRKQALREALGDALANAGRGAEAAEAYLAAAGDGNGMQPLELRRRAAEQLLISGHVDQGIAAITEVLAQVGLRLAPTPARALLALLVLRLWIAIRGLGFKEADSSTVPPRTLARIDVAWSTAAGLSVVDNVRAAHFQTRNLLLCLRAGEPTRLLRALVLEAVFVSLRGPRHLPRARAIIAVCEELHRRHPAPDGAAMLILARASSAYFTGLWSTATDESNAFLASYRDGLARMQWELRSMQYFALCALIYLGELPELAQRLPAYLREARDRGDLYFGTNLDVGETNLHWLIEDRPADARRIVHEAMERWSKGAMQVQHWYALQSLAQVDLYTGEVEETLTRVERELPRVRRSLLLRVQHTRVKARWLRARCALATGVAHVGIAEQEARALEREGAPWATALSKLVRAGIRCQRGDRARAAAELRAAIEHLDRTEMHLFAAAARRTLGVMTKTTEGSEGDRLVEDADAWLRARGVQNPTRLARLFVPGCD
ncbi:MAG: AAA family ATPase [Deltaproteobacteria bacterium]|nr:AAA family ATPase [Deltaproteobacteria bacterium]